MSEVLTPVPALDRIDLLAPPVAAALTNQIAIAEQVKVAEISPKLADTAEFCEHYGHPLRSSANCVVVAGKRAGEIRYVACVVLATTRVDVNNRARRYADFRKASFAPMDTAVELTGMEYGGITPVGLPKDWPLFVDPRVIAEPYVVIGSGLRRSKIFIPGPLVARLPGVQVVTGLAMPAPTDIPLGG